MIILFKNSGGQCLLANGGGKINFVMRRADAGCEDDDEIAGSGAEVQTHLPDGLAGDIEFGAIFPRMEEADCSGLPIEEVKSTAVGDVNAQEEILIRDETVNAVGQEWGGGGNDGDLSTVDLVCMECPIKAHDVSGFVMIGLEAAQSLFFVGAGSHTGNPLNEVGTVGRGANEGGQKERRFLHGVTVEEASIVRKVSFTNIFEGCAMN